MNLDVRYYIKINPIFNKIKIKYLLLSNSDREKRNKTI